jgi:hypothetical protein
MVSGAVCSGRPGAVGFVVAGGFAVADDGGTVAVGVGVADALVVEVGPAVGVGLIAEVGAAVLLAGAVVVVVVVVGAAVLPVGAGAGGPKQPESENRAHSPRMVKTDGLAMMPPWVRALIFEPAFTVGRGRSAQQGL